MAKAKNESKPVTYCDACGRPFEVTEEIYSKLEDPQIVSEELISPPGIVIRKMQVTTISCPICWIDFAHKTHKTAPEKKSMEILPLVYEPGVTKEAKPEITEPQLGDLDE